MLQFEVLRLRNPFCIINHLPLAQAVSVVFASRGKKVADDAAFAVVVRIHDEGDPMVGGGIAHIF